MTARFIVLISSLVLIATVSFAQQPIPIIHPGGGGGGGGGAIVPDNITIKGNGASAGSPVAIKAVQVDGTTITGTGAVGSPLVAAGANQLSGIGGTKVNVCGADKVCNVINFGADPSGTNDSEPAFRAAETAASTLTANTSKRMYIPAGAYRLDFPFWVNGNPGFHITIEGAGAHGQGTIVHAPIITSSYTAFNFDGGAGVGNMWTSPLTTCGSTMAGCQSAMMSATWWLDYKSLQLNGATVNLATFNGLSQIGLDGWVNITSPQSTGEAWIVRSMGTDGTVATAEGPIALSYSTNGTTGSFFCDINLSGGIKRATVNSITTNNNTHYVECNYDGSHVNIFIDGVLGQATAASGTVVDQPYFSLVQGSGESWPVGSAGAGVKGQVFGLRLSKIARNSSNYTAPTQANTCDSNTMLLINGTKVWSDENTPAPAGPFVQPECVNGGTPGSTADWMYMHFNGVTSSVALNLSGIYIQPSPLAGYGLVINQSPGFIVHDVNVQSAAEAGMLVENNSYFATIDNYFAFQVPIAAELLWPGEICTNCTFDGNLYEVIDEGGNTYTNINATVPATVRVCYISFTMGGGFQGDQLNNFDCDNENNSNSPQMVFQGAAQLNTSAMIAAGSGQTFAPILVDNNTNLTIADSSMFPGGNPYIGAGFGHASISNTVVKFTNDRMNFGNEIVDAFALTDGKGENYDLSGAGVKQIAGTTAGTAALSCPTYTDQTKTCYVNLVGYKNATTTAQLIMMPASIASMSPPIVTTGLSCSGVSFATGSNAGCVGSLNPYPCCTGAAAGTCNATQFVTLPANMSTAQTVQCETIGD